MRILILSAGAVAVLALVLVLGGRLPATREGRADRDGMVRADATGARIDFVADEMSVERIALRFTSDAGYSGAWQAIPEPVSGGTRIAVRERATLPSDLGRIMARLLFDPTEFATTYLAQLKTRVEDQ